MKRILFVLAIIILSFAACNALSKYTIRGKIEGQKSGNAYLVRYTDNAVDTLAKAPVVEGEFTLTGKVECLTDAFVVIEGKEEKTLVFVENAGYTIKLNPSNPKDNKIEGTETQALANKYSDILREIKENQSSIYFRRGAFMLGSKANEIKQFQNRIAELQAEEKALIEAHADSYVVVYMIAGRMSHMSLEELNAYYGLLGENAKATGLGKMISSRITKLSAIAIGSVAPDFTLNTPEGEPLSMHSIKGKVKIIDFWASWCGGCRVGLKNVIKIYEEFHPKGLEILNVSLDTNKEAWLKAIEDDGLPWKQVCTSKGWKDEVVSVYDFREVPHLIVLDENNVIVAKNLSGEDLRQKIAEMLK